MGGGSIPKTQLMRAYVRELRVFSRHQPEAFDWRGGDNIRATAFPICYTASMTDTDIARHVAPQPDDVRHTLTVRDVEKLLADAGVQRSHRHVLRLCQSGMLDAVKIPGGPSGEEWYVAPASVPKAIGDLTQIDEQRSRRGATQPATADHVAAGTPSETDLDTASHGAPQHDVSEAKNMSDKGATQPDMARRSATDPGIDIFQHPYVKKLEERVERLEEKYEAQVRRTEEIQLKGTQQLLELQRMTAVGQSQTLADFMLKAKDWILGPGEIERKTAETSPLLS
jgi:hypothetical protein